jgi:hypothetical protein
MSRHSIKQLQQLRPGCTRLPPRIPRSHPRPERLIRRIILPHRSWRFSVTMLSLHPPFRYRNRPHPQRRVSHTTQLTRSRTK